MHNLGYLTLREILTSRHRDNKIPSDLEIYINECGKQFREFCAVIGVNVQNLQGVNHRYKFSAPNAKFINYVLDNYTRSPISELRGGAYEDVTWKCYIDIERFIESVMTDCDKDFSTINSQLLKFRHKTGWIYKYDIAKMKICALDALNMFYSSATNTGLLSNDDRLLIFSRVRVDFCKAIETFFERWDCIVSEFKDERSDEISNIDTTDGQVELVELGSKLSLELQQAFDDDNELAEWNSNLAYLQNEKRLGHNPDIAELEAKICERKDRHKQQVFSRLGITPSMLKRIQLAESCKKSGEEILQEILQNQLH